MGPEANFTETKNQKFCLSQVIGFDVRIPNMSV